MNRWPVVLVMMVQLPALRSVEAQASGCIPGGQTPTLATAIACVDRANARADSVLALERQIRATLGDQFARIAALSARLDSIASRNIVLVVPTIGPVVNGDLVVKGRLCIGAQCIGGTLQQIQILGQTDAAILLASNLNGTHPQSPAAHYSQLNLSGDGGMRLLNNAPPTGSGIQRDAARPYGQVGFDSQATWSHVQEFPGFAHEPTQDFVFLIEPSQKHIALASYQSGWIWKFVTSSCKVCLNQWWVAPTVIDTTRKQ